MQVGLFYFCFSFLHYNLLRHMFTLLSPINKLAVLSVLCLAALILSIYAEEP